MSDDRRPKPITGQEPWNAGKKPVLWTPTPGSSTEHRFSLSEPSATIIPPVIGRFIPWLQTLAVASIGAFVAAALQVALSLLTGGEGPDPWTIDGLRQMARTGGAAAIVVALAYLKGSPLVRHEWSEEERAAQRAKLEAQGRLPAAQPTDASDQARATGTYTPRRPRREGLDG